MRTADLLLTSMLTAAILELSDLRGLSGPGSGPAFAQPSPAPFEGYAELPGVRLWYVDSGGPGVPIVLLHANTGNADSWAPNTPGLVTAGYRVIAFDRRGWGRSEANPAS